ncbi:oxidoreductase domain-containing protein [Pseudomassariella vexata]|uniref:Oxidoreductase domain-containing protein n=1 Tax=Pseudomassariella vexata TaxID=1141098 RepID=A0A1Y2EIW1_9PEZI|nr:oxidoreductase domain-containing protein [Pseudomassariella vexata]ORY71387.1 oxidoreductase domain-containing protein [Pseudomassariella vexata]
MAESKKLNVGVIGYGLSAKVFHIPFIKSTPTLNLHSILQRTPTAQGSAPADYPSIQHHTSLDSFLADAALDLVVLSVPPQTHFSFAKQALEAGKHVFVEKPFVPTSQEADQLIALAKEKSRMICVYQNRRWDSDFLTVRKLIAEGTLGRIVEFETHFDRLKLEKPASWKGELGMDQGGGALYDLGTHLIDQAYVLFGMPRSVFAKLVDQRDGAIAEDGNDVHPDSVTAQLFYEDGTLVHVRIAIVSVEKKQLRYWIRGTKGSYRKLGLDPQEDQLKAGLTVNDAGFGYEESEWNGTLTTLGDDGKIEEKTCPTIEPETYGKIYELYTKALHSGKEEDIPVPASQARDVLRIIEAAKESAKNGREVKLS